MILPTIKQLQYLTALFEHGHFGKAAEACFVTQSTLSAGLRELETALDAALVERTKRVVRFTPLGEKIARKAYLVLREATEIAHLARAAGKPLAGELRLGVIPTIAPFFLPKVLPGLRAAYPELKLYLREEMSHVACDALARGHVDCVLLALPYPCGDVEVAELFDDTLVAAFHRQDLPATTSAVLPSTLDNEHLLLLEDGHCLRDHSLAACERPDLRGDRAILGTSLHTLVQMVDNRLGLTLLPQMAIDAGILEGTDVVTRPLASDHTTRRIALVWRRRSPRDEEFRLLAGFLRAAHDELRTDAVAPATLAAV
ncbi:hydrogen peroxide-inducible genes activator [Parapedomonas caeni]|jgi:LysR family hydrogen peroxide-inducible transcriptional activator